MNKTRGSRINVRTPTKKSYLAYRGSRINRTPTRKLNLAQRDSRINVRTPTRTSNHA